MATYIGSSADDSIGAGTLLLGTEVRRSEDGWELCVDGDWTPVYDVAQLSEGSIIDHNIIISPMKFLVKADRD